MLCELRIRNLAIVEDLSIAPGPGLNVLSGETGAGKSILIDAIELLLGGKASTELIRTGADQLRIDGRFQFESDDVFKRRGVDLELSDGTLLLSREVGRNGRSRILVNDEAATLGRLKSIGERLADLHGQHEHQSLLRIETHLEMLDRLAATHRGAASRDAALGPLDAYRLERAQWLELTGRLVGMTGRQGSLEERRARLELEIAEIRAAGLRPDEESELKRERQRLLHAGRLIENVGQAADALVEGEDPITARLGHALRQLAQAAQIDESLSEVHAALEEVLVTLNEQGRTLAAYREGLQFDPERAEWIEGRLSLIARLRKKYAATEQEILALADARETELGGLADEAVLIGRIQAEIARVGARLMERGKELTAWRRAAASRLEKAVQLELASLGMGRAQFLVRMGALSATLDAGEPDVAGAGERGFDAVEFFLAANPGEEARPLARIASGGELSRVMLALKTVLRAVDPVPILLFDEVDAGIGGAVAGAVGERLHDLARSRQVFVITHLPMVASHADLHFRVEKVVRRGRTVTDVRRLEGPEREAELARMLAGAAAGSEALDTARALLLDSQRSERRKGPG